MNTYIRNIYSPGFAYMTLSFYRTNLSISFVPWVSRDKVGRDRYDNNRFVSTTINDESAASLYFLSKQIVEGTLTAPAQYQIQCSKQCTLSFEYGPGQDGQMKTHLIIEKEKDKIAVEFQTHEYRVKEDGKITTKIIQSGLMVFAEVLSAYLSAVAADRQTDTQAGTWNSGAQSQGFASAAWR